MKAKVFITFSGDRSLRVATALREWLPGVIQLVEPWVATRDIHAGGQWPKEVGARLSSANAGILPCAARPSA